MQLIAPITCSFPTNLFYRAILMTCVYFCNQGSNNNYTSWNITLLDQIYTDFAVAVGNHTVAMQLSTLPSWMFTDGMPLDKTNPDPWQPNFVSLDMYT